VVISGTAEFVSFKLANGLGKKTAMIEKKKLGGHLACSGNMICTYTLQAG